MLRLYPLLAALLLPAIIACAADGNSETADQQIITKTSSHPDLSWALVLGKHQTTIGSGNSNDWVAIEQGKARHPQGFVWVKTAQGVYELDNPELLAEVGKALEPMRAIGAKMEDLGKTMGSYGQVMEGLGEQIRYDPDNKELHQAMDEASAAMDELSPRMDALGNQQQAEVAKAEDTVYPLLKQAIANARPVQ